MFQPCLFLVGGKGGRAAASHNPLSPYVESLRRNIYAKIESLHDLQTLRRREMRSLITKGP